jgi:hypothetical protein
MKNDQKYVFEEELILFRKKKLRTRGSKSIGNTSAVHENLLAMKEISKHVKVVAKNDIRNIDARLSEMKVEIIMHICFGLDAETFEICLVY